MKRNIIGFLGGKQSGKDTASRYIIETLRYKKYAFGDPVKDICKILFCLDNEQLNNHDKKEEVDQRWGISPRQMFQRIGTELGQFHIYKLFPELKDKLNYRQLWVRLFEEWMKTHNDDIVISDVRFIHEIKCIQKYGGIIVKIDRSLDTNDMHVSEQELDKIPDDMIDYVIKNNYTKDDLFSQIDIIINMPF